jgi:hypothetical protein
VVSDLFFLSISVDLFYSCSFFFLLLLQFLYNANIFPVFNAGITAIMSFYFFKCCRRKPKKPLLHNPKSPSTKESTMSTWYNHDSPTIIRRSVRDTVDKIEHAIDEKALRQRLPRKGITEAAFQPQVLPEPAPVHLSPTRSSIDSYKRLRKDYDLDGFIPLRQIVSKSDHSNDAARILNGAVAETEKEDLMGNAVTFSNKVHYQPSKSSLSRHDTVKGVKKKKVNIHHEIQIQTVELDAPPRDIQNSESSSIISREDSHSGKSYHSARSSLEEPDSLDYAKLSPHTVVRKVTPHPKVKDLSSFADTDIIANTALQDTREGGQSVRDENVSAVDVAHLSDEDILDSINVIKGQESGDTHLETLIASVVIPPKPPSGSSTPSVLAHSRKSSSSNASAPNFDYKGSPIGTGLPRLVKTPRPDQSIKLPKRRKNSSARSSKFKEEFHTSENANLDGSCDGPDNQHSDCHLQPPKFRHSDDSTNTSGTQGSRLGNYTPLSGRYSTQANDTISLNESMLQPLERRYTSLTDEGLGAWQHAVNHYFTDSRRPKSSASRHSGHVWNVHRNAMLRSFSPSAPASIRSGQSTLESDSITEIAPDEIKPQSRRNNVRSHPGIPVSWARFPSHTRNERNGPAGIKDNVDTYDFVQENDLDKSQSTPNLKVGPPVMKTKTKNMIQVLKDRWALERSDLLRMERGTRSSVSVGGVVRYPDLELLPKMDAPLVDLTGRKQSSSIYADPKSRSASSEGFDQDRYGGEDYGSDADLDGGPAIFYSTKYRLLVQEPTDSVKGPEVNSIYSAMPNEETHLLTPKYTPSMASSSLAKSNSDSALNLKKVNGSILQFPQHQQSQG